MDKKKYIEDRSVPIPFAGCWMWMASFGSHGYGNASTDSARVTTAHRVSYEAFKGAIPKGMLVQHSCDNKWCVNPDHLSVGTDKTNALDKQYKGRAAMKLRPETVTDIANAIKAGQAARAVARTFGISQKLVQGIRDKKLWRHVTIDILT